MVFVAALLTSAFGIGVPSNSARAVDCLTTPNSAASQNDHWYYRTDRAKQRKCWYLRSANRPSQRVAVQTAREAPPAKSLQSVPAASPHSGASFRDFMANHGGANLSDKDLEELYAQFLEWSRRAKN
jgi:hypothetical protein